MSVYATVHTRLLDTQHTQHDNTSVKETRSHEKREVQTDREQTSASEHESFQDGCIDVHWRLPHEMRAKEHEKENSKEERE